MKRLHILISLLFILLICAIPLRTKFQRVVISVIQLLRGKKTVEERIAQYGPTVHERLRPDFERIDATYPPDKIVFVGIKQDNVLEVWVGSPPKLLKTYPVLGASGKLGPKLQEGDRQVPEGLYEIESLNPNSLYHLALRINYPNPFDIAMGKRDGRNDLGTDIMIHGKSCSIGCLAMGDKAIEELFVVAYETGTENISVILTPVDFRKHDLPKNMPERPEWTSELYESIRQELMKLRPVNADNDEITRLYHRAPKIKNTATKLCSLRSLLLKRQQAMQRKDDDVRETHS